MSRLLSNNPHLNKIAHLLTDMELQFEFDEAHTSLCTGLHVNENLLAIIITPIADYWLCLSTWGLCQNPLTDDTTLVQFYKDLLKENNYTKLGKFYITEDNHFEFAIDLKLEDVNEDLLGEALHLICFVISEKLPQITEPYLNYLFPTQ